jgi:hypothetical protein
VNRAARNLAKHGLFFLTMDEAPFVTDRKIKEVVSRRASSCNRSRVERI